MIKVDKIRIDGPDGLSGSSCLVVVCVQHIHNINDKCLAYRVAEHTPHFCRIYAPGFPARTHRKASVYIYVWIVILRPEIERLYVLSATKICKFSVPE